MKILGCIAQAFTIDSYIDSLDIVSIAGQQFAMAILLSLESIVVDAWVLTILEIEMLPKGALANVLGQSLGS